MATLIVKVRSKMRRRVLPLINYISRLYQSYGGLSVRLRTILEGAVPDDGLWSLGELNEESFLPC